MEKFIFLLLLPFVGFGQFNPVAFYEYGKKRGASWDIGNITFLISSGTFPDGSTRKNGIYLKPDGTRLYGASDLNQLSQYDLTTPWDISTITSSYLSVASENNTGITLRNDGSKVYTINVSTNLIRAFNLTVSWDVSAKTTAETTSVPANSRGLDFNGNGTLLFVMTTTTMYSYSLSTAWDVSTKTLITTKDLSVDSVDFRDIRVSPDGVNFYLPSALNSVKQYKASVAWDISTIAIFKTETRTQIGAIIGLWLRADGKKLYTASNNVGSYLQEWDWD